MTMSTNIPYQQSLGPGTSKAKNFPFPPSFFSPLHHSDLKGLATVADHHIKEQGKSPKLFQNDNLLASSDQSHNPCPYLVVKFPGGEVIHCHLKPLVNFYEDDLLKKMKQGWCVLCDLKPVDSIGRELDGVEINVAGDGFDGKLIGTVEWDGKRFEAISKEHLDLEMFLTILKKMLSTHGEKGTQELIELVIEEGLEKKKSLQLLKQMLHIHGEKDSQLERLELEKLAEWKVNFLAWTALFSLLVILGVFIRYVNSSFDGSTLCVVFIQMLLSARLTWWELDWDTVEPFSFVFMFSLLIAGFAYFVLTKKDLTYQGVRRRVKNILFIRCLLHIYVCVAVPGRLST